jgi:putative acetyltransferase
VIDPFDGLPEMWQIREETADDFGAVRDVHERAFASTEEANLVDALRSSGASVPWLCLVALAGDSVVDIAFSRAHLDSGHPLLVLAPMGVLPAHQGRGAGAALVSEGLRHAAETEFPLVAVVGHAAYYPRFGFEPAAALRLEAPFDLPAEAWMAYRLPEYTPAARGTVVYPEAFAV